MEEIRFEMVHHIVFTCPLLSAVAYDCSAAQSMDPYAAAKKMWLISGSLPNGRFSRVSRQLQARPRTVHIACILPPMPKELLLPKKLYRTRSVAVIPAPVHFGIYSRSLVKSRVRQNKNHFTQQLLSISNSLCISQVFFGYLLVFNTRNSVVFAKDSDNRRALVSTELNF